MMKKAKAVEIAKLWNTTHANYTEGTMTYAVVKDNGVTNNSVEIHPTGSNEGECFFECEILSAIAKAFQVHAYIGCRTGKCVAYIY